MKTIIHGRVKWVLALVLMMGVVSFIGAGPAVAEVPKLINYQGLLIDDTGVPVNGTFSVQYAIYDVDSGPNPPLWSELQNVTTQNGIYNVLLGSATPIPDNLFAGPNRYLGVKIGIDPEMVPRQRFTSVPYALNAQTSPMPWNLVFNGIGNSPTYDQKMLVPDIYPTQQSNGIVWVHIPEEWVPDNATLIYCGSYSKCDGWLGIEIYDADGRGIDWVGADRGGSFPKLLLPFDSRRKIGYRVLETTTPIGANAWWKLVLQGYVVPSN